MFNIIGCNCCICDSEVFSKTYICNVIIQREVNLPFLILVKLRSTVVVEARPLTVEG